MPVLGTAKPFSEVVTVRFKERQLEAVVMAAEQEGISISELCRTGTLSFAAKILNPWLEPQGHAVFNPESRT